jgi:hypothetical protein
MKLPKHMYGQEWPNGPLWIARLRPPFILSPGVQRLGFQCWPLEARHALSDHTLFRVIQEMATRWAKETWGPEVAKRTPQLAQVFDEEFKPPNFLMLDAGKKQAWILEPHPRRLWSVQAGTEGTELAWLSNWGADNLDRQIPDATAQAAVADYFLEYWCRAALG